MMEGVLHGSRGEENARTESRIWFSIVEEGESLRDSSLLRDCSPRYPFRWARSRFCCLEAEELSEGGQNFKGTDKRLRDPPSGASSLGTILPSGRIAFDIQSESCVMDSPSPGSLVSLLGSLRHVVRTRRFSSSSYVKAVRTCSNILHTI
jgi:hypothetical protein